MDKYFTPNIEDIRVGYELEMNWDRGYNEAWVPLIIGIKDKNGAYLNTIQDVLIAIDDGYGEARVPYLTKEQIEAEGWIKVKNEINENSRAGWIPDYELATKFGSLRLFIKDLNKPYLNIDIEKYTKSNPEDVWSMSSKYFVYRGECKDINTFHYICKLLNIN